MRSTYSNRSDNGPFTELNTRPPGYEQLADRVTALEKIMDAQGKLIEELYDRLTPRPAA